MMPETITIGVTDEDIRNGARGTSSSCPIALALKRQPGIEFASVGAALANIGIGPDGAVYRLSIRAQEFVTRYDHGETVQPITTTMHKVGWA